MTFPCMQWRECGCYDKCVIEEARSKSAYWFGFWLGAICGAGTMCAVVAFMKATAVA